MNGWQYGCFDEVRARMADGRLAVRVDGVKPAAGFHARLRPYAPDPDATADVQLGLYWRAHGAAGAGEPVGFTARAEVDVPGIDVVVVRVYHASGFVDLRVRSGAATVRGSRAVPLEPAPE